MENIELPQTEHTPTVLCNATDGSISITGDSLPEDAKAFYQQIIDWVRTVQTEGTLGVKARLFFNYFNSSSAKQIIKLFYAMEEVADSGKSVEIEWCHAANDVMIKERGEELAQLVELPFTVSAV